MARLRKRTLDLRTKPRVGNDAWATRRPEPVVYAARLPNGAIEIGFSKDLRVYSAENPASQILAYRKGTKAQAAALQKGLQASRIEGQELYRPTVPVLDVVNHMRVGLGLKPLKRR